VASVDGSVVLLSRRCPAEGDFAVRVRASPSARAGRGASRRRDRGRHRVHDCRARGGRRAGLPRPGIRAVRLLPGPDCGSHRADGVTPATPGDLRGDRRTPDRDLRAVPAPPAARDPHRTGGVAGGAVPPLLHRLLPRIDAHSSPCAKPLFSTRIADTPSPAPATPRHRPRAIVEYETDLAASWATTTGPVRRGGRRWRCTATRGWPRTRPGCGGGSTTSRSPRADRPRPAVNPTGLRPDGRVDLKYP